MEHLPEVSILMTAFNRDNYIGEAIESVLASSFTDFELIILDDCSSDDTVNIARAYEKTDKRIKVHVNPENLRQFKNRNKAVTLAKGEFIMWVDSDDTIYPNGVERLVNTMKSFPESSFGMYWYEPTSPIPIVLESKDAIYTHFFVRPILGIGPGGTIMKRSFFSAIGGYTDKYNATGDMHFNLKACCHSSLVQIPFEFMTYRRHEQQEINNPYEYLYNSYLYLRDAITDLPLPLTKSQKAWLRKKNRRRFLTNIVNYYRTTRDFGKTRAALKIAQFGVKETIEAVFH